MIRPKDIPAEVWENLPDEIRFTFARDANRSFINPVIDKLHKNLKKCLIINHKINQKSNDLRSLTIRYTVEIDSSAANEMALVQESLVDTANIMIEEIKSMQDNLLAILHDLKNRILYYEGELNG